MQRNLLTDDVVKAAAQGCQNCYQGEYGDVDWSQFQSFKKHVNGNLRWYEAIYKSEKGAKILFILLCGTRNKKGWKHNLDYDQSPVLLTTAFNCKPIILDEGFWAEIDGAKTQILNVIKKWKGDVVVSGHSQGGATAPILAMLLAIKKRYEIPELFNNLACLGEAGPRFTDSAGVKMYKSLGIETLLFRNAFDPVPKLPPRFIFGRRMRKGKYRFVFLRYKHVAAVKQVGIRNIINMLKNIKRTYEEMRLLFHSPEDYNKAISKKFSI